MTCMSFRFLNIVNVLENKSNYIFMINYILSVSGSMIACLIIDTRVLLLYFTYIDI